MSMLAKWMFAVSLSVSVTASGLAQAPGQIDKWVRTLFVVTPDFDRDAAWQKTHARALAYVHDTKPEILAKDLNEVLARTGMNSTAGAGAAYLMAMHGIEPEKNLRRLITAHRVTSEAVEDSLPEALADIAVRRHSREAARALVAMPNGDYEAEAQAMAVCKLFLADPSLIIDSVADSPSLTKGFLELLPFGAWNSEVKIEVIKQAALRSEQQAHGAWRDIYRSIAKMKDYGD